MRGIEIYTPYASRARILKGLLVRAVKAGWQGLARSRVLIAAREPLALENLVREVPGDASPVFALSLGTPGRYRKLTVQVMGSDGEILGYIKLPLTEAATERLRHEAEVLSRLGNFATLRPHVPKLLHAGEWADGYILFQSRGPSCPGPAQFGAPHEKFLRTLWSVQQTESPGQTIVEKVAARWRKAEPLLSAEWRILGKKALDRARRELDRVMIPCGIMHGDFAPWNTRVENGRLFVFDWESAVWDAPTLWDVFHFHVQVAGTLSKEGGHGLPLDRSPGDRSLFLLYILSSLCQFFEEKVPRGHAGTDYRHQLLSDALSSE